MTGDAALRPRPDLLGVDTTDRFIPAVFLDLVYRTGALHRRTARWPVEQRPLPRLPGAIASTRYPSGGWGAVGELEGALVSLELDGGNLTCALAASDPERLEPAERAARALVPPRSRCPEDEIWLTFWCHSSFGSSEQRSRAITVPRWRDVARNYASRTRASLAALMGARRLGGSGQLVLFHGAPGTGKTFAVRALAREWRDWCEVQYVVDPEALFGSEPDYLLDVLTDRPGLTGGDERGGDQDDSGPRWRLLILEDTGELLHADAKERTGQGLSRLLNLVDGVLGQGQRLLVLVTTNEPLGDLHPAVARPGRCAATVEFSAFEPAEATAWLRRHDRPGSVTTSATLAALYARLDGQEPASGERPVGFAAALGT